MSKLPKSTKRCPSLSPGTAWRCEHRKKKHPKQHRAAFLKWGLDEGSTLPFRGYPIPEFGEQRLGHEPTLTTIDEAARIAPLTPKEELRGWWFDRAEEEINRTVPKAVEYSATDLIDIGRSMARAAGHEVDDGHAAELAIAFYALGKVSRIMGSIERGELPNMDSWFDLGVYARMAQRVRQMGGWPGTPEHTIKQQTYGQEPQ